MPKARDKRRAFSKFDFIFGKYGLQENGSADGK
jgi:hypothetical protein